MSGIELKRRHSGRKGVVGVGGAAERVKSRFLLWVGMEIKNKKKSKSKSKSKSKVKGNGDRNSKSESESKIGVGSEEWL